MRQTASTMRLIYSQPCRAYAMVGPHAMVACHDLVARGRYLIGISFVLNAYSMFAPPPLVQHYEMQR